MLLANLAGLFTGDAGAPTADADAIVVRDGLVADVGRVGGVGPEDDGHRVDAGGGWAMPGLWDGALNLYFGDHTPVFSAAGALVASVGFGVTSIVAVQPARVPGTTPAARFQRELAVLTMKSWAIDRPGGLHVHAGAVAGHAAWDAEDLTDLAAHGADLLMLPASLPFEDSLRLAAAGREVGLRIGLSLHDAEQVDLAVLDKVLAEVRPAIATPVNTAGLSADTVDRLVDADGCALGLVLAGDLAVAARVARACVERGDPVRPFLGTGLPDQRGVLPAGVSLFIDVLAAMTGLERGLAVAMATGNVARAFGHPGGLIARGQPADVVVAHDDGGPVSSWLRRPAMTLIDGEPDITDRGQA